MRTRRELVEAYLFITRRIVSAMMSTNPDALELPMRRTRYSVVGGTMLALLIFGAFWVIGMFMPAGNDNWKEEGAIVLDEDTGALYVYMQETLFPMTDLASARLLSGRTEVATAEHADLEGTPRGWELGIPDAPQSLPDPESLVDFPWQVCSAPDHTDDTERVSHVALNAPAPDRPLEDEALAVRAEEEVYLLLEDRKLAAPDPAGLLAIGIDPQAAVPVDPVFVAAVPSGPDLATPEVDQEGEDAGEIGGVEASYGDLFASGGQNYVLTPDGLAPLGEVATALMTDGGNVEPTALGASEVSEAGGARVEPDDFPQELPEAFGAPEDAVLCAVAEADETITTAMHTSPPEPVTAPTAYAPSNPEMDEVDTADHVWLPAGSAALVREAGAPGAADGTVYFVTEQGLKHALSGDAANRLGYGDVAPPAVSASLLALVPTGPALDREEILKDLPFEIE